MEVSRFFEGGLGVRHDVVFLLNSRMSGVVGGRCGGGPGVSALRGSRLRAGLARVSRRAGRAVGGSPRAVAASTSSPIRAPAPAALQVQPAHVDAVLGEQREHGGAARRVGGDIAVLAADEQFAEVALAGGVRHPEGDPEGRRGERGEALRLRRPGCPGRGPDRRRWPRALRSAGAPGPAAGAARPGLRAPPPSAVSSRHAVAARGSQGLPRVGAHKCLQRVSEASQQGDVGVRWQDWASTAGTAGGCGAGAGRHDAPAAASRRRSTSVWKAGRPSARGHLGRGADAVHQVEDGLLPQR